MKNLQRKLSLQTIIKIVLAMLFFLCLLVMPFGFYHLVRFVALIGFGILAYQAYEKEKSTQMIIYLVLGLLFQPLLKVALEREIWIIVDVIVGIGLLSSLFLLKTETTNRINIEKILLFEIQIGLSKRPVAIKSKANMHHK